MSCDSKGWPSAAFRSARLQYRPAYHVSEPLRRAMKHVGDRLFAPPPGLSGAPVARAARVWRLGPLRS